MMHKSQSTLFLSAVFSLSLLACSSDNGSGDSTEDPPLAFITPDSEEAPLNPELPPESMPDSNPDSSPEMQETPEELAREPDTSEQQGAEEPMVQDSESSAETEAEEPEAGLIDSLDAPAEDDASLDPSGVISTDNVRPFRPNGPFAAVLKQCVLVNTVADSCNLETLPFIGQETQQPTVEDVLNRLLVTHDWMGERFAEVLEAAPDDLLPLFASTTSVVIGSEVRPSFYTVLNGGIQLDPAFLWQSLAEKRTISVQRDFRSDFGSALQFQVFRRIAIDGERATRFFSLQDDSTREFSDLQVNIMSLLYHELGHANDFLPSIAIAELDSQRKVFDALRGVFRFWLSPQLEATLPLNSSPLLRAAGVRFLDNEADDEVRALEAADAGLLYSTDGALDFYSYTTIREDMATLLEYSMMRKNYDLDLNIGFIEKIEESDDSVCADFIVGWGTRNRLANPLVTERARWVTDNVFGITAENTEFFTGDLGMENLMTPGVDWCTNNDPAAVQASRAAARFEANAGSDQSGHQISLQQLEEDRRLR